MTAFNLSRMAVTAAAMAALGVSAMAQSAQQQDTRQTTQAGSVEQRVIVVSLVDHELALVVNGEVEKVYPVAVGKASTPSPVGDFTIARRVANPIYQHDGRTILPGPHNPVGNRWMGLSIRGYGIHGTNEPRSIGKAASHGCIRMGRADIEDLFARVRVGDTVELVNERNAETALLFGDGSKPAVVPAAMNAQTAKAGPAPVVGATKPIAVAESM